MNLKIKKIQFNNKLMLERSAYLSVRYALKLLEKGRGHRAPKEGKKTKKLR